MASSRMEVSNSGVQRMAKEIKVRYRGLVQNIVSRREEDICVCDEADIGDVLQVLIEKYGDDFKASLFISDGRLRNFARVLVNGTDMNQLNGLKTELPGQGEISVLVMLPPVSGGCA